MQLSTRNGMRWGVREGYLYPAMKRANLTVATGARATRMLFEGEGDNQRASGVEYRVGNETRTAHAAREVAVTTGSIHSPQLLELSGIGDAGRLQSHGIAVRKHLPGVGENLRDHLHARLMVEVQGLRTLNDILRVFGARLAWRCATRSAATG